MTPCAHIVADAYLVGAVRLVFVTLNFPLSYLNYLGGQVGLHQDIDFVVNFFARSDAFLVGYSQHRTSETEVVVAASILNPNQTIEITKLARIIE